MNAVIYNFGRLKRLAPIVGTKRSPLTEASSESPAIRLRELISDLEEAI